MDLCSGVGWSEGKKIGANPTLDRRWEKSNLQRFIDSLPVQKEEGEVFKMDEICEATIVESFDATSPDDISVKEGDSVTVLNLSDPDWIYIRNSENQSGFVPFKSVKMPEGHVMEKREKREKWENENLLVVDSFTARSPLDLTVRPGEWIRCGGRPVDDWLWACRLADEKQGFIPNKVVILATDL
uniref:SH3 domain-containing protein n=1 Tax=Caenorhabditis tropicalis TaxID=1561998 RepID=A0A1I7UKI4_9PELO